MNSIDLLTIISVAFLGSIGHCIGMCGGIVIAYSSTKIDEKSKKSYQALAHLIYSFGRITTYTVMGVVFGAIGGVVSFNNIAIASLTIFAGVVMVLTGLSIIGKIKFLTLLEHSLFKSSWYQKSFKELMHSKSLFSFYILGLLNGLLPCGLVYFFAVTAASTASAFWGGVVMFVFGLSTIPSLFSLGFFTSIMKAGNFRKVAMNLASIIVIIYGVWTIYRGYDFIKNPNKSLLNCCSTNTDDANYSNTPKFKIKP